MISKNKYLKINNFYKRVDPDRPNWVRLYGRKNYRQVLRNFTRHWTSMISNDMIHNRHQNTRFRSLTDRLCCIVVKETKILFNLRYTFIY